MARIGAALCLLLGLAAPLHAAGPVEYLRDVKPVLERRCVACHGALEQKGGLRLDTAAAMKAGGDSGPAVEPGNAADSLLVGALTGDAGFRMPPPGEGAPLSAEEQSALRAWIDAGATAPADEAPQRDPRAHWAFQPPERPAVPTPKNAAWVRNPIDAFLAAEHDRRGLTPVGPADRETLLRRATVDLTGLIPTPEERAAFLAHPDPDAAYADLVERLLASPRYGERWGRHWMDVWRYADWAGYQAEVRESQPHIWRWRDWIVRSLNADKPYDAMVRDMIAGDEIAPDDPEALAATGYLVRNWYKFNRHVWLQNTVDHTAKAFLGLTLACARCHDHKYDPIPQSDWYRFRAVFEPHDIAVDRVPGGEPDTKKAGLVRVVDSKPDSPTYLFRKGEEKQPDESKKLEPGVPAVLGGEFAVSPVTLPADAAYPALKPFIREESRAAERAKVEAAERELRAARDRADAARRERARVLATLDDPAPAQAALDAAEAAARAASLSLDAALASQAWIEATLAADDAKFAPERDSKRADLLAVAAQHAGRQAALRGAEARLAKAEAGLLDGGKPAKGDMKKQAEVQAKAVEEAKKDLEAARKDAAAPRSTNYTPLAPPRPATSTGRRLALARWMTDRKNPLLARVAVNHVWMRHFGEPLVPTVFDLGVNGKPASNPALLDWLAVEFMESGWSLKHLHRLIVTSSAYRMASSAPVDHPNVAIDPQNVALWRMSPRRMEAELVRDNVLWAAGSLDVTPGGPEIAHEQGLTSPRRSLYFQHAAEKQVTFLKLFDAANVAACYRRDLSVVPQQALALANSPLALSQSRVLAGQITSQCTSDDSFIESAFVRLLGRAPDADERAACLAFLAEQARRLADPATLTPFASGPKPAVAPAAVPGQRARENLVHVLFNHNDFVTIR
jgi:hypothetical protein